MTSELNPLALNELLDRPLIVSLNSALVFLRFVTQDLILLFREACLTPELTGRETMNQAFNLADESHTISAPVQ
jgi:hypothetical protein